LHHYDFLGEMSMEKVHVKRYVAGKRPEWANEDDEESSEEEDNKVIKHFLNECFLVFNQKLTLQRPG